MISSAGLVMLVHAIGAPSFRVLLPTATSSAPLLIDLPTPSSVSRGPEGAHAQSDKELRSTSKQACSAADTAPSR
jgi:hypothetical protein